VAKDVILDVARMRISNSGVADFAWPLARAELLAVRDRFLGTLLPYLREEARTDRQAAVLALLLPVYSEVLAQFQAHAVTRRLRESGITPVLPVKARLFRAAMERRAPNSAQLISMLERGAARAPRWRRTARSIRDSVQRGIIRRRELRRVDAANDVITVATGDMIVQHATVLRQPVNYVRFEEWFYPLAPSDGADYGGMPRPALVDTILDHVRHAFAAGNETLPDYCAASLQNWLCSAGTLADRYITRLLRCPGSIPRHLWRGTGGHLWSRLLSFVTRELGGHVTGHDHAHGSGAYATYVDTVIEHPACDRFMVRTEMQRQMSQCNLRADLSVLPPPPNIEVVPGCFVPKIVENGKVRSGRSLARPVVMYVGTVYRDEVVAFTPLIPAIVLVDWEARLIGQLQVLGYDVIVKPHPESEVGPPQAYFDELGARLVVERFEDVYQHADIILFGQSNCTPFFGAVGTTQPIAVADTGVHKLHPEAADLLGRRCAFVASHCEIDNKIAMDWAAVASALRAAPVLRDQAFYDAFCAGKTDDRGG
jgi:hypothetical protein